MATTNESIHIFIALGIFFVLVVVTVVVVAVFAVVVVVGVAFKINTNDFFFVYPIHAVSSFMNMEFLLQIFSTSFWTLTIYIQLLLLIFLLFCQLILCIGHEKTEEENIYKAYRITSNAKYNYDLPLFAIEKSACSHSNA